MEFTSISLSYLFIWDFLDSVLHVNIISGTQSDHLTWEWGGYLFSICFPNSYKYILKSQLTVSKIYHISFKGLKSHSVYIYIYIYMCVCVCVCVYIYIYIYTYLNGQYNNVYSLCQDRLFGKLVGKRPFSDSKQHTHSL